MLGHLFGSNTRVKILKIFLLHPEEKYYIRQLARKLKLQVNSVRRELENLDKFGLLISSVGMEEKEADEKYDLKDLLIGKIVKSKKPKSNSKTRQEKKYYQADKSFVLFEEIKALIVKSQVLYEKDFINKLQKIGSLKLFVLTGIFISKPESATDMFIVGKFNKDKLSRLVKNLENELGKEINFTSMDLKEFRYRRDITDTFLYEILEGEKIVVIDEVGIS